MMNISECSAAASELERFEYRLIYLRPTAYSDERIAVGVVAAAQGQRLEGRFLSTASALDLMVRIFGAEGVDQFQFAVAELRRLISRTDVLDSLEMPTDLLFAGEKNLAVTPDRTGLLTSLLAGASCLVRADTLRSNEVLVAPPAAPLMKDLFDHVTRLNPLRASSLFNQKIVVDAGDVVKTIELPILGNRVFGAPVSFASSDLRMRAESYVAKFNWLRKYLSREPKVYLLAPRQGGRDGSSRTDSSITELRAVADASNVTLGISTSTEELAVLIVKDDAA